MGSPRPKRFQAGVESVTLSSGDGTADITFDTTFQKTPAVVLSLNEDPGAGKRGLIAAKTITTTSFTIVVDSDSASSTINVGWIAMEQRSSEKAGL
jgi:hypothetical protein